MPTLATQVYVASIVTESNDATSRSRKMIGVYSSESLAKDAIENFVEGVLGMVYPTIRVVSELVDEYELDASPNENPHFDKDGPPF